MVRPPFLFSLMIYLVGMFAGAVIALAVVALMKP